MIADGFLLVDKPGGWTSHDVVAKVRGLTRIRKVGHAGTLDPMATGLLVLGLGRATRLLRFVQQFPKEYEARAMFGVGTDTLDADGRETERIPLPVTAEALEQAAAALRGEIDQIPPMTSAIKVEGRKLYELARRGEIIERPSRRVHVYELEVTGVADGDYPLVDFRVTCSAGTYVRTLADDMARSLGGPAHLVMLRRTRIGSLHARDAVSLEALTADPVMIEAAIVPPSDGLADLARRTVGEDLAVRIAHGAVLSAAELPIDGTTAVLDGGGRLLAVYAPDGGAVRPEVVVL